ncbi:DUF5412 family protein [Clostridium neuense]|uniref:DUF5412 family protein n=1 Tax=Clostridium neuense TaxID=1728934 RepID=A0ABW8TCS7_9CLOT
MKCKKKLIIAFPIIAIIVLMYSIKIWSSNGMVGLPKGVCLSQIASKDSTKIMKVYKCNSVLYGDAARVEIYNKETGTSRNILWSINSKNINVKWEDDKLVLINGNEMNVNSSYYVGVE